MKLLFVLLTLCCAGLLAQQGPTSNTTTQTTNSDPFADLPDATNNSTSIHQDNPLAEIVSEFDGSQRNQMEDETGKIVEIKKDAKSPTDMWDVNLKPYLYPQISQQEFEALKIKAETGLTWAQNNLGVMYATGNGTIKNTTEAFNWYKKAGEKGDSIAENNLGYLYLHGLGVDQDKKEAVKLFNKSIEHGNLAAQVNLAIEEKYKGNLPEAIRLFTTAADKGNLAAVLELYSLNASNDCNLTEATKWLKKAAELGDFKSQYILGYWYATGRSGTIPIDLKEGNKWYKLAANNGVVQAQEFLPATYYDLHDYKNAMLYYKKLSSEKLASYQCSLASGYKSNSINWLFS